MFKYEKPADQYNYWLPGNYNFQEYHMKFFFSVIGMVMIIEGLPYFASPAKMKEVVKKIINLEDTHLRKFGFVLMLAGLCIVYFAMGGG